MLSRSHEAPSVGRSRGSGMYDDVSLKHPSVDPPDQMMEDSEEQSMHDDPVLANRSAPYLATGSQGFQKSCIHDRSAFDNTVLQLPGCAPALKFATHQEILSSIDADFCNYGFYLSATGIWPILQNKMTRMMQMQSLGRPQISSAFCSLHQLLVKLL